MWPEFIPYAVFMYNNTHNSATGFAPFEIVYGRSFQLPTSINSPTYNYESYTNQVKEKLKSCTDIAKENLNKRKEYNCSKLIKQLFWREFFFQLDYNTLQYTQSVCGKVKVY